MSKASEWIEKAQWVNENSLHIEFDGPRTISVEDEGDILIQQDDRNKEHYDNIIFSVAEFQQIVAWFKENFEDGTTPEVRKDN